MKITLRIIMLLTGLSLMGCSKISNDVNTVQVSLVTELTVGSKAALDGDGAAAYADQCRLQIIMKKGSNETLVYDKVKSVDVTTHMTKFDDVVLLKNQTYDFMFWADNAAGEYYTTSDLKAVTIKGDYVGCNDKRDAFYAAIADTTINAPFSKTIVLRRPFAQLNVITKDIDKIDAQLPSGTLLSDVLPNKVVLNFTAPSVFNVLTGLATEVKDFSYEAPVYTYPYKTASGSLNTLSMDYIYAPAAEPSVNTIGFTAKKNPAGCFTDISLTFDNIPLQRNYRTNIVGDLLSDSAEFTVIINPDWTSPDFNVNK